MFLFAGVQASYCYHPSGSRKNLSWIFFMTVLKLGVFLRLLNLLPLTAKSGWTANKDVNQNPSSTGITGQNLHVYQKTNSIVTVTSQANFTSGDLTLTHVDLLAGRVMEWCICSVFECGLREKRYFSFFSFFSSVLQERRESHIKVGYSF